MCTYPVPTYRAVVSLSIKLKAVMLSGSRDHLQRPIMLAKHLPAHKQFAIEAQDALLGRHSIDLDHPTHY